jgi:hypothetical protein
MNVRSTVAVAAALGAMAVGGAWKAWSPRPLDATAPRAIQGMKWTATLNSMNGSTVKGTASLAPGAGAGASVATISITGGQAGAVYPWHVHLGKCPAGGVFGGPSNYKPITAGADGSGTSTANLTAGAPTTGDYHVNVHASPTDMKTIVACGDLTMAM